MNASDVISINPGKATVGDLNPEATAGFLRYNVLSSYSKQSSSQSLEKIFGIRKGAVTKRDYLLLSARVTTGILLILCSFLDLITLPATLLGLMTISLISGLFQRITMSGSFLCILILLLGGYTLGGLIIPLIVGLTFSFISPGHISADKLIFNIMRKHSIKKRQTRIENSLSYKSYLYN